MGVNFPNAPSAGQKFTSGKTLYTFTNGAWLAAPLGTALPFNYLVNPALQISQENGNNFGSANGFYSADQWRILWSTLTGGVQRFATTQPLLAPYYVQWYVSPAKPTLAVGDYSFLFQPVEGARIADFMWGTANAKAVVVRFTASAGLPGTYAFNIRNGASNRSYVVPIAITGALQEFIIPIPGDTTGTWPTDATVAMQFCITGASGSTYLTSSPNSWQAGNFLGQTGMANQAAADVQVIIVGHLGLYVDPDNTGRAPPWESPPFRQDLFDCLRYWQRCNGAIGVAAANVTTHQRATFPNMAPMRIVPATALGGQMRAWDQALAPNITAIANSYSNTWSNEFNFTSASAQTLGRGAMLIDCNGSTIYIAHNARM